MWSSSRALQTVREHKRRKGDRREKNPEYARKHSKKSNCDYGIDHHKPNKVVH
jgi:hypothetical protein